MAHEASKIYLIFFFSFFLKFVASCFRLILTLDQIYEFDNLLVVLFIFAALFFRGLSRCSSSVGGKKKITELMLAR